MNHAPLKSALALVLLTSALVLSACADEKKKPLEGTRIPLFAPAATKAAAPDAKTDSAATPIDAAAAIPQEWDNGFWPQAGGFANHAMKHVALGDALKPAWTASFGEGAHKTLPLTAAPVVADGRLFALDADAKVAAIDAASGQSLWRVSVLPQGEDDAVIGGGVGYAAGKLFVTAGFRELVALNPADGTTLWRATLPNAARSAPTATLDGVYVTTVDNQTIALSAATGKQLWRHQGLAAETGLVGAATPAATGKAVVPVYSSGEIYVLNPENGATLWTDTLARLGRAARASDGTTDIHALPVADETTIVATSFGGTIAAYDPRTGTRRWSANAGGAETPWLVGNRIYAIDRQGALAALATDTGKSIWSTQLPDTDADGRRQTWFGPILAGGRLVALSDAGTLLQLDTRTGAVVNTIATGTKPYSAPIVANRTLFIAGQDGQLTAWR